MNTTDKPLYNLNNYVKLNSVIRNTTLELRKNTAISDKDKRFFHSNDYIKLCGGFNSLIATGYYQIAYNKDNDMIKTNFDYTGSNKNVLLDFNVDALKNLINTSVKENSKDIQGVLY